MHFCVLFNGKKLLGYGALENGVKKIWKRALAYMLGSYAKKELALKKRQAFHKASSDSKNTFHELIYMIL